MKQQMIRSLTFQDGNAENAMNFYVELFDNSKIINLTFTISIIMVMKSYTLLPQIA